MTVALDLTFDAVVCNNPDEQHSVRLLGEVAVDAASPNLVNELAGKNCVAVIDNYRAAGIAYSVGAEDVWLIQTPGTFRNLRHYFGVQGTPESAQDQLLLDVPKRWQEVKHRARLLRREDHPSPLDASRCTGLPTSAASPFPTECLPPIARAIVEEGARAQGVDAAMFATPLLPILSGAIGNSIWLVAKRGYHIRPMLWAVTCCVSGSGKSPPLRLLSRPLLRHDQTLTQESEAARRAHWRKAKVAQRSHGPGESAPAALDPPPPRKMCVLDDCTMESMIEALADNPKGLTVVRDEFAGLIESMDAYRSGKGGDEPRWLQLYDGTAIKVTRKTGERPLLFAPEPALSLAGTVQPGVAVRLFTRQRIQSGLMSRFLFALPPIQFADWSDAEIPEAVLDAYERLVDLLLALPAGPKKLLLRLSTEAKPAWDAFYNSVNPELRSLKHDDDDSTRASLVKMRAAALRIAIVLAATRAAEEGQQALSQLKLVERGDMENAIKITRWFMGQHAILCGHQRIAEGEPWDLVELIRRNGGRVSVRTLMRVTRRFATATAAKAALDSLLMNRKGTWVERQATNHKVVQEFVLNEETGDAADADTADAGA